MNDYYDRKSTTNSDGTPLFATDRDKSSETATVLLLREKLECDIYAFGPLCPVDFYAIADGRLVGVLELKSRSHSSKQFPTVFLNVRKWLALKMAMVGLGCSGLFVVRFTDGVYYIKVDDIPTKGNVRMGGTKRIVKSQTDIEPVIHVPVKMMKYMGKSPEMYQ